MPFKSEKQRRWMFANKPEMAKRWASEYHNDGGMAGGQNMHMKKVTQKDRYGNQMTYEFESAEKPLDPTALMKHQMDMMKEIPDMMSISPVMGEEFKMGDPNNHPGEPMGQDTVPAWLTPGEFVVNAEATEMFGPQIEAMNEVGKMAKGGMVPGYNTGGPVPFLAAPLMYPPQYRQDGGDIPAPVAPPWSVAPEGLDDLLHEREGWRDAVYLDSLGKPTVGAGHLIADEVWEKDDPRIGTTPYSNEELHAMFESDRDNAVRAAVNNVGRDTWVNLNPAQQRALSSMAFQLGPKGQSKFKKMLAAVQAGDYSEAAKQAVTGSAGGKSKWLKQTPKRALDLAEAFDPEIAARYRNAGGMVYDDTPTQYAFWGKLIGNEPENEVTYSEGSAQGEIDKLLQAGYTPEEIRAFMAGGVDPSLLVDNADILVDAAAHGEAPDLASGSIQTVPQETTVEDVVAQDIVDDLYGGSPHAEEGPSLGGSILDQLNRPVTEIPELIGEAGDIVWSGLGGDDDEFVLDEGAVESKVEEKLNPQAPGPRQGDAGASQVAKAQELKRKFDSGEYNRGPRGGDAGIDRARVLKDMQDAGIDIGDLNKGPRQGDKDVEAAAIEEARRQVFMDSLGDPEKIAAAKQAAFRAAQRAGTTLAKGPRGGDAGLQETKRIMGLETKSDTDIENAGNNATDEEKQNITEQVRGFLEENLGDEIGGALGSLFDAGELAKMGVYALGSMAFGAPPMQALSFGVQKYIQGVEGKAQASAAAAGNLQKQAFEAAKTGKFTQESLINFQNTGNPAALVSKDGEDPLLALAKTGKFTRESLAAYQESGNPLALVPRADAWSPKERQKQVVDLKKAGFTDQSINDYITNGFNPVLLQKTAKPTKPPARTGQKVWVGGLGQTEVWQDPESGRQYIKQGDGSWADLETTQYGNYDKATMGDAAIEARADGYISELEGIANQGVEKGDKGYINTPNTRLASEYNRLFQQDLKGTTDPERSQSVIKERLDEATQVWMEQYADAVRNKKRVPTPDALGSIYESMKTARNLNISPSALYGTSEGNKQKIDNLIAADPDFGESSYQQVYQTAWAAWGRVPEGKQEKWGKQAEKLGGFSPFTLFMRELLDGNREAEQYLIQ